MKVKRGYYRLILGTAISAVLLLGACGQSISDKSDIDGTSELDSEEFGDAEGNVSVKESFELTDNATNEESDKITDNLSGEEATETANEEIMGWRLEGSSILRDGKEMHTVPCSVYYDDEFVEAAFASESSAYVAYFLTGENYFAVDYTHDGGITWETTYVDNEFYTGMGCFHLSFWNEMEGCILYCSDAAMGHMDKILFRTTDGGKSFEMVHELSDEIKNYPTGLAFCERDRGLIITQNHGDESYAYLTKDGGKTWIDYRVEVPNEDFYTYVDAKSIHKDVSTGAWDLVLRGATNGDWNMIYCTSTDDWETWQIR